MVVNDFVFIIIFTINIIFVGFLFLQTAFLGDRFRLKQIELDKIKRLEDMPTVSLCIPARNETHALADCLSAAIASDYPKLEVIVLDDCSHDQTSQIIKSFAHDGVRFIKGDTPSDGWLGKNNAYSALAEQAKGSYIVFMSVDTRLSENSISQIVSYMQLKKLSMMSILPQRYDNLRASVIFAPLRYFWQTVLPLKFNTPLATSIWAITDDALAETGGFESYKEKVDVENRFANMFWQKDEYRFLVANDLLQISYEKQWSSQADTAIRLWYLNLEKSHIKAVAVIALHFIVFVVPFVYIVFYVISVQDTHGYINVNLVLAFIAYLFANVVYLKYFRKIKRVNTLADIVVLSLSFFMPPVLALQEIVLITTSYIKYKRGKVDWKGRNICFPVTKRY